MFCWQRFPSSCSGSVAGDSPGGATVSNIDITEVLRDDVFGPGAGDHTSGYILKPGLEDWIEEHVNIENLRISVTRIESPTPTFTPVDAATPTPTPLPEPGVTLILPDTELESGDLFLLRALCTGDAGSEDYAAELYVVLDVMGNFWFHPGWTPAPQYQIITLQPGQSKMVFLLEFTWPDTSTAPGTAAFWGALLEPGTSLLIGTFDHKGFTYF